MAEARHRRPLITSKLVNSGEREKQTVVAAGMVAHRDRVSVLEVSEISLGLCNSKCAWEDRAMTRAFPHTETSHGRPLGLLPPCPSIWGEGCGLDVPNDVAMAPWALWRKLWSVSLLSVSLDMQFRMSLGL